MNVDLCNIKFESGKSEIVVNFVNEENIEFGLAKTYLSKNDSEPHELVVNISGEGSFYKLGEIVAKETKDYSKIGFGDLAFLSNENISLMLENFLLYNSQINFLSNEYVSKREIISNKNETIIRAYEQSYLNAYAYQVTRLLNHGPHSVINPDFMCTFVQSLFKETEANVTIYRKDMCSNHEFNGLLAVSQGSYFEPAMIKIEFNNSNTDKVGLVGKGLTFDMGGYSIKTGADLSGMKKDMAGCNAVIGAMYKLVKSNEPVNVVAYLCVTDNLINDKAIIPGDVISYPNNISVEVLNTDAEGRLVLADGLQLACREECKYVVDIATLTGNVVMALGSNYSGIMSNDESLTTIIKNSALKTEENVWELPLCKEYEVGLKSDIADLRNISSLKGAGCISAGLFLQHFITDVKWTHIDMAAMSDVKYLDVNSNGYGVRLLSETVKNISK